MTFTCSLLEAAILFTTGTIAGLIVGHLMTDPGIFKYPKKEGEDIGEHSGTDQEVH